jgi:hypothetical protein
MAEPEHVISLDGVHDTHNPKPEDKRVTPGCVYCRACGWLLTSSRKGLNRRGGLECPGSPGLRPFNDPEVSRG